MTMHLEPGNLEPGNRESEDLDSEDLDAGSANRHIVAIVSPKGGVGRTVIATNLAIALAERYPEQVALADLDIHFGEIRHTLGARAKHTLAQMGRDIDQLTAEGVRKRLVKHGNGLAVLPGADSIVEAECLTGEATGKVLRTLSESYPWVVLDMPVTLSEVTVAALDECSDVVVVSSTDIPGIRAARQMIDVLDGLGSSSKRHLLINRTTGRYGISVADVEEATMLKAAAFVPASKYIAMATNEGVPALDLLARSELLGPLSELGTLLGGGEVAAPLNEARARWWRRAA